MAVVRSLLVLALLRAVAAATEDCADGESCAAAYVVDDSEDSSLLARRAEKLTESSGRAKKAKKVKKGKKALSSDRRRRQECSLETGQRVTLTPTISDFTSISVAGEFDVDYDVGSGPSATVTVDSGLQNYVSVTVSGGTLYIKYTEPLSNLGCYDIDNEPQVRISSPNFVSSISTSADASFEYPSWPYTKGYGQGAMTSSLTLTASSDSQLQVRTLTCPEVTVTASSDADVDLDFLTASTVKITASSNAEVEGGKTTDLTVDLSSSAEAKFTVTGAATGTVTSGAELTVKGGGDTSGVSTSSGGEIDFD